MAKISEHAEQEIGRDAAGRPAHTVSGAGHVGDLDMWVDIKITFPAAQDGNGRPLDLRNLKRAVEAFEQAGVDPSMSIEIERTERGFFLSTGG